jgi:hypothetical protein
MSMVLYLAPKMGMPRMDIVGLLSTMFSKKGIPVLGWMMHLMMGVLCVDLQLLVERRPGGNMAGDWCSCRSGSSWV